jgi:hypothetical protein
VLVTIRSRRSGCCGSGTVDASGWALLQARLRSLRHRGAIIGPHGSGKTTLLEDLARRLEANGWRVAQVRLTAEFPDPGPELAAPALRRLGSRDVLLIDGAEQLSRWRWLRLRFLTRHIGGLVITTHEAGRLPTLWRCSTTPELLRDLSGSLGVPLAEGEAVELFSRHSGNLRDALRELYDRHAEHTG